MASQISDYKCPACTGPLRYDGTTGKLQCDYCGSAYTVEEIEKLYAEQDAAAVNAAAAAETVAQSCDQWETTATEWTEKGMKAYVCPSCGAELILDSTTAATECPYCGNTTIMPGQFAGTLKPEYIIPFKLDKETAENSLKKYYKGKLFLPKAFTQGNHVEDIKGVYVPFWLYDGEAHGEGRYEGKNISTHREGDDEVTVTEYYEAQRAGDIAFEKIPADASSKMPDDLMDSIEPYDYSELTGFSSAYLAGFMADKYDVSAEENAERAVSRAKQSAKDAMRADVRGYDSVTPKSEYVEVHQGKVSYALMPVWLLNTKWNGENFLFAMNGQSGRFVGKLPTDNKKMALTFCSILAVLELLTVFLLSAYSDGDPSSYMFCLIPLLIAFLITAIFKMQMNNVHAATAASQYVAGGGMTFTLRRDYFEHREESRVHIQHEEPKK